MVNPASRQIYLTFPADSTFREEEVSNYFSIYGPVQNVGIPYQQKSMFGFVKDSEAQKSFKWKRGFGGKAAVWSMEKGYHRHPTIYLRFTYLS